MMHVHAVTRTLPPIALPPSLNRLLRFLCQHGFIAFVQGGAVRDLIRSRTPNDYDLKIFIDSAVHGHNESISYLYEALRILIKTASNLHIVSLMNINNHLLICKTAQLDIDICIANTPWQKSSLYQEALKADLTMNALFLDCNNHVIDPLGVGIRDSQRGFVHFITPAPFLGSFHMPTYIASIGHVIASDPIRLLRCVRLITDHQLNIDPSVAATLVKLAPHLNHAKYYQLKSELKKILLRSARADRLAVLDHFQVLAAIFPAAATQLTRHRDYRKLFFQAINPPIVHSPEQRNRRFLNVHACLIFANCLSHATLKIETLHEIINASPLLHQGGSAFEHELLFQQLQQLCQQFKLTLQMPAPIQAKSAVDAPKAATLVSVTPSTPVTPPAPVSPPTVKPAATENVENKPARVCTGIYRYNLTHLISSPRVYQAPKVVGGYKERTIQTKKPKKLRIHAAFGKQSSRKKSKKNKVLKKKLRDGQMATSNHKGLYERQNQTKPRRRKLTSRTITAQPACMGHYVYHSETPVIPSPKYRTKKIQPPATSQADLKARTLHKKVKQAMLRRRQAKGYANLKLGGYAWPYWLALLLFVVVGLSFLYRWLRQASHPASTTEVATLNGVINPEPVVMLEKLYEACTPVLKHVGLRALYEMAQFDYCADCNIKFQPDYCLQTNTRPICTLYKDNWDPARVDASKHSEGEQAAHDALVQANSLHSTWLRDFEYKLEQLTRTALHTSSPLYPAMQKAAQMLKSKADIAFTSYYSRLLPAVTGRAQVALAAARILSNPALAQHQLQFVGVNDRDGKFVYETLYLMLNSGVKDGGTYDVTGQTTLKRYLKRAPDTFICDPWNEYIGPLGHLKQNLFHHNWQQYWIVDLRRDLKLDPKLPASVRKFLIDHNQYHNKLLDLASAAIDRAGNTAASKPKKPAY